MLFFFFLADEQCVVALGNDIIIQALNDDLALVRSMYDAVFAIDEIYILSY